MNSARRIVMTMFFILVIAGSALSPQDKAPPHRATLISQFTTAAIKIDGMAEDAWNSAKPSRIGIAMTGNLSAAAPECKTYGEVRSLWDGALLYLLIDVKDADVTAGSSTAADPARVFFRIRCKTMTA